MSNICSKNSPIIYLAHGGGPLPLLGDPNHNEMVKVLKSIASTIIKPSAIIVISAHWEESMLTITGGSKPSLIYDYYGFPVKSYEIQYPAIGEPVLAKRIQHLLQQYKIESKVDSNRGFDHGMFVPLKIMYPQADIPCIQISLKENLDPWEHIQLGQALRELRDESLLFIGSGLSFHNLKQFFPPSSIIAQESNLAFERWLKNLMTDKKLAEEEREKQLLDWDAAPGAQFCHPREEHLLPLHVCYGVAGAKSNQSYHFNIYDKQVSCYLWN